MGEQSGVTGWRRRVAALSMFAVTVSANVVYVLAGSGLEGRPGLAQSTHVDRLFVVGSLATAGLGLALSWLRPANLVGWLLAASGLTLSVSMAGQNYGARAAAMPEEHLPLGMWVLSLSAPLWIICVFLPVTLLLVRYPSGEAPRRWRRAFEVGAVVGYAVLYLGYATSLPSVTDEVLDGRPPVLLPESAGVVLLAVGAAILVGSAVLVVLDAVRRAWRADPRERSALLLLMVTGVTAAVLILGPGADWVGMVAFFAVLAALAVGVLRYEALGIETVARRTLVYLGLTGLVLAVFVGVTTVVALVVPAGPAPQLAAATVVAVLLTPAKERLQAVVERVLYGRREDSAATLRRLGESIGSAPADGLLTAVAANLCDAIGVDGVRVRGSAGDTVASWGEPSRPLALPLLFGGQDLGTLDVGRRRGGSGLGRLDRQLVETVAPLVAALVYAVRLGEELRTERNRVLLATGEERDRLRRELHDGLGPSLTGIALGLEAAQSRADARADDGELLARLRTEVTSALEETRRLIDDLGPAALDGVDLVTALRNRVATALAAGVEVDLVTDDPLPALPAPVEAAALRIVDEALTNALRHGSPTRCCIVVRTGTDLVVEVSDDGRGLDATAAPERSGVGLTSMRQRAERLGGSLLLQPRSPGLTVVATLPLTERAVAT